MALSQKSELEILEYLLARNSADFDEEFEFLIINHISAQDKVTSDVIADVINEQKSLLTALVSAFTNSPNFATCLFSKSDIWRRVKGTIDHATSSDQLFGPKHELSSRLEEAQFSIPLREVLWSSSADHVTQAIWELLLHLPIAVCFGQKGDGDFILVSVDTKQFSVEKLSSHCLFGYAYIQAELIA